ncbi:MULTISPECIES: tRNA (adenosine(37)-N6)-dimethylallyltransferase MiaA [unclassified Lentimicrobium]|uniref:tRNA (adenosine(37)-N6)-dimethylallyltransferase MiaA n=1 Tax=unclassified Lentimicrobium TaxID=2677434 RepID=UPI001557DC34|nr:MULTISPECIES: tRNA (adenosine(37)-N6)-dimethylallyltransferase MiaA [unclassified Lentimicrobium]NPD45658.1 tRNA (adenosine(37)-N6)-dimethylallyltransferase MiaA [Lentimicrobium sp. S6]NPD86407.1 tRNA (adenosine(37)-N6)-dimethylallyltransferase MiaA [Lentimicrobium sp. L6]
MKAPQKQLLIIAGPTAVGKTRFAIELAQLFSTEIISADSRQFYKEMCIGTAVPSSEELAGAPHHFIQNISIAEPYNVHKYEMEALTKIHKLFEKQDVLIAVGGSGLYLNALAYGIDELPDPSEETRTYLEEVFQNDGVEGLRMLLRKYDPEFYKQVDLQNPNRIKRALEVCLTTGDKYSKLRLGTKKKRGFDIKWIGLKQDRAKLYDRINLRVDLMITEGLLEEVKQLYPRKDLNALNTVGYREFFKWLDGEETYEWAVDKVKTNSRRYAKRQMTWFTKNEDIEWLDMDDLAAKEKLFTHLKNTISCSNI